MCISIRLTSVNWYFTTKMEWSMECCLCYFGFLWICEITVPLDSLIDPNKYLCVTDLAVDNRKSPKLLGVTIKWSKTDPFRKHISFLSRTSTDLCPLSAIQVRERPPVDYSQICAHDKEILLCCCVCFVV